MPKFYRTTFTIEVLSAEPIGDCLSLAQIDYMIDEGPCVGTNLRSEEVELTGKQMADALHAAGSTPDFFSLDDDGNVNGDDDDAPQ